MKAEIYGKNWCAYCNRAKQLLEEKGIEYVFYNVEEDESKHQEMMTRANNPKTVPQVFLNGDYIGGFDQLRSYFKNKGL